MGEIVRENLTTLSDAKASVRNGTLTREDYWRLVQGSISSASGLSAILAESGSSITVSELGIILKYPITPTQSVKFFLDAEDTRSIGTSIVAGGRYEPVLQEALLKVSTQSKTFIDVGANVGFYSISVRATNPTCNVIAFECNPKVANLFIENIEINEIDNITIYPLALSDKSEKAEFYVPAFTGSGGGSLRDLHPEEGESYKFTVDVMPLDSLSLEGIDLMKIDVEGAELGVILGGLLAIKSFRPTIFIELLRKWMKPFGSSPADVSDLLIGLGYLVFEVTDDEVIEVAEITQVTQTTNYIFVHPSRPSHLSSIRGLTS